VAETFRVVGEEMSQSKKVGLGRVTISSRERPVLVEPRGAGLVMSTLLSADEFRPAEFGAKAAGEADPEMVAIAETSIERRSRAFEPASFRDRYQDALRELVEAKTKGLSTMPRAIAGPPKHQASDAEPETKKAAWPRHRGGNRLTPSKAPASPPTLAHGGALEHAQERRRIKARARPSYVRFRSTLISSGESPRF
jgi:DNA end-binding protein Ku